MKKIDWKGLLVAGMLLALLAAALFADKKTLSTLSYQEFWTLAERGDVESVSMGNGENWKLTLKNGDEALTPNPRAQDGKERLLRQGIRVTEENAGAAPGALYLLLFLFGGLMLFRLRRTGATGMARYASVQADEHIPDTTFADVAVHPETLQAMEDLVAFLKTPEKFRRLGARPPKGVMLYGPPGTGKTLLARALAGEAHAPFFAMSGADFVQVYVGVGASRVRELFKKARKAGGGVIFIDEIDAIGKRRDSGNDEREQTLNALLTEMSGFSGADGIMVLAATNRLDTLDSALLREGRFDRRIRIDLPDLEQRERILRVHARNKPFSEEVNLSDLAAQTVMFSGAQLEALLNEAAIRAGRQGKDTIGQDEIDRAFYAVAAGEDCPGRMREEEKRITACHEAGHALVTRLLMPESRIKRVTIIPSSRGAAGYSMSVSPDRMMHTKKELQAMIAAALGGRAAEEMMLGKDNVTTGAAGDLAKAREIAGKMAGDFAMGEGIGEKEDTKRLLTEGMESARRLLTQHREAFLRLAEMLMEKETLNEAEISACLDSKNGEITAF